MKRNKTTVIIPAAGCGKRINAGENKAWLNLCGKPMIWYSLQQFRQHPDVREIIIVVSPEDIEKAIKLISLPHEYITEKVVCGGEERYHSVWNGLQAANVDTDIVLIHDAARPFINQTIITDAINTAAKKGAFVTAIPVADTLKSVDDGRVAMTIDRSAMWAAQTPQGGKYGLLYAAYSNAIEKNLQLTDDAGIIEANSHTVYISPGSPENFKITWPHDFKLAEKMVNANMKTGFGYDVHRLVEGRDLILGGVKIPYKSGLLGHSDADVLVHAIMDALLGAATLGDIGKLFPDTDIKYSGANSIQLLKEVTALLTDKGFSISNIDTTLVAQSPKISPYIDEMRKNISEATGLNIQNVSVKATTTEGLGFAGTGEGMAAYANILLFSVNMC
jgi:2-C-methyl-D-erythritol 4-phosphate cytidylyltransferase/2-C-methyl-D-erythritol 2,4-cyclodiphosphate synthase